tara:strand:+ start:303 stop:830 length:528 start_codon:yes stop_codon:yes gene_type:complete
MKKILEMIQQMQTSKVSNYVIAGLDSYLLENGNVRVFKNSRNHQDQITPHSHRFDFACLVLQGHVVNKIWSECSELEGDFFESSKLTYSGEIGVHSKSRDGRCWYKSTSKKYSVGEVYSMKAEELHSIDFGKDSVVLFFEGAQELNESYIIEPVVNGVVIPTYEKKSYMFIKDES